MARIVQVAHSGRHRIRPHPYVGIEEQQKRGTPLFGALIACCGKPAIFGIAHDVQPRPLGHERLGRAVGRGIVDHDDIELPAIVLWSSAARHSRRSRFEFQFTITMSTVKSGVRKVACRALLWLTVTALHPFRAITQQRRRHASSEDIIPQSSAIRIVWCGRHSSCWQFSGGPH